ncbi:MAG: universal stress protein [Calditrichota bacterium]
MKVKRIVVPLDFSKFSDEALSYAIELAKKYSATLYAFHSIVLFQSEPESHSFSRDYDQYLKLQEEDSLALMAKHREEAEKHGVLLTSEVRRGFSAAEEVLQYAEEVAADLIVMGTHGRTGIKRWFYGSVSERVVRLSPHPVITVHKNTGLPDHGKILVPVDFSDSSQKAALAGSQLAKELNLTPVFMHVVEYEIHPAFYSVNVASAFVVDENFEKRVTDRLKEFVNFEGEAVYLVKEGRAWNEIVEYARSEEVALITMGTRGLTGLDHLLIGSTAERVARFSEKPVLSIRTPIEANDKPSDKELKGSHS